MGTLGDYVEARGIEKGLIQSLQKMLKNTKMTVQQAMDILEIPDDERSRYAKLVEQGNG